MKRLSVCLLVGAVLAACAGAPGATGPGGAGASAAPTAYPSGFLTPRPAPSVGDAKEGTANLTIDYVWPHLVFTTRGVPAGTYSVIYVVQSTRSDGEKLQIDATDPAADFQAKLEYLRLREGDYTVTAFVKGSTKPFETRPIHVP